MAILHNFLHNILKYFFGTTGSYDVIDRTCFWTAMGAVATVFLLFFAWRQLADINKTTRADFYDRFIKSFFNSKTRDLFMLFEYGLLIFKIEKVNGIEQAYFELDKKELDKISHFNTKFKESLKEFYFEHDINDDLLGFFEDIGGFTRKMIINKELVYDGFSYYIESMWENKEINKFIKWERKHCSDIYENFEYIYNEMVKMEKR